MAKETVKRLDAACRLLNAAISLWSEDGDAVAAHVLACSAYQVVHDMNHHQGGRDLLYDSALIKETHRQDVNKRFKKAYNFFKHADQDPSPDATIEFDPAGTELFILFAENGLEQLGRKPDSIRCAFLTYFCLHNPGLLTEKGKAWVETLPEQVRWYALNMPKQDCFKAGACFDENVARFHGPFGESTTHP